MEAEFGRPDSYHTPEVQRDNGERDDIKHCIIGIRNLSLILNDQLLLTSFSRQLEAALRPPEAVDTNCLRNDSDDKEIGELEGVV